MSVVCLEQGGWPDYEKARSAHPDYELTSGVHWAWDPNVRRAPGDYPIDDSGSDIKALMWNGVGGGTVVYAAHWQRNLPSDFRVRTLDGVGDDWPLSYEELEPYYVRVERDWGVSGLANDTAFPPGEGPPMPPVPLSAMGRKVAKAHNDLGWHWWPGPNAIATQKYGALNPCVLRATCLWGCADGAKATVDRTYWPVNQRNGVELITRARVRRLLQRPDGLIEGAEYLDADGNEHVQRAGITIVGANGIGTRGCSSLRRERRPGQLVGPGRQAAHAPSLRHGHRAVRGRHAQLAGRLGAARPLARVLRDRRGPRPRSRSEVRAAAHRGAPVDDARLPVGRGETPCAARASTARSSAGLGHSAHVGHHRRGPARGVQPGLPRSRQSRRVRHPRREDGVQEDREHPPDDGFHRERAKESQFAAAPTT